MAEAEVKERKWKEGGGGRDEGGGRRDKGGQGGNREGGMDVGGWGGKSCDIS